MSHTIPAELAALQIVPGWTVDDGNYPMQYPYAESGLEAAEECVSNRTKERTQETYWINVVCWRRGFMLNADGVAVELQLDRESHTIAIEPDEPDCEDGHEHDWRSPYSVLGGVKENPGVWGNGGGVLLKEVCAHCGTYRITDTWAQCPSTGEQGLHSTAYEDADECSLAWVQDCRDREMEAALADIVEPTKLACGSYHVPDSSECERLLDEVRAALPEGWAAEWADNDLRIDYEG